MKSDLKLSLKKKLHWIIFLLIFSLVVLGMNTLSLGQDISNREPTIRFQFKGATFDEVLDFFARESGLPVIREVAVPSGVVDYLSPRKYNLQDALGVFNVLLQTKGVMLRLETDKMYLQKLENMKKENVPTYMGKIPSGVTPDQIVTVVRPLELASSKAVAEKLKDLVDYYGSVVSLDSQNALVITETASNANRIIRIVEEIDKADPEGTIKIIPLKHIDADQLMPSLMSLLSRRIEKYVVGPKGTQVKVEENQVPGLTIASDNRTNSIIAKGSPARILELEKVVTLLDVVSTGINRKVRVVTLLSISTTKAREVVDRLFLAVPKEKKPIIFEQADRHSLAIVGEAAVVDEAVQLLESLQGKTGKNHQDIEMRTIKLKHLDVKLISQAIQPLLTAEQKYKVRIGGEPSGRILVLNGSSHYVDEVISLVSLLDQSSSTNTEVRLLKLREKNSSILINKLLDLEFRRSGYSTLEGLGSDFIQGAVGDIDVTWEGSSGTLTLLGKTDNLNRFIFTLNELSRSLAPVRETRPIEIKNGSPEKVAVVLEELVDKVLNNEGEKYDPPIIKAVEVLRQIVVTAEIQDFQIIESLLDTIDRVDPEDYRFRSIDVRMIEDTDILLKKSWNIYKQLSQAYSKFEIPDPKTEIDELTGRIFLSGRTRAVNFMEQAIAEATSLMPPARQGRLIVVRQAKALDILPQLEELVATLNLNEPGRRFNRPTFDVIDSTNSIHVYAEPVQLEVISSFIRELDTIEIGNLPPMKLLQVRAADAIKLAKLLESRYSGRPSDQRRLHPVQIDADEATNTLIVTAHIDIYDDIRRFVEEVNRTSDGEQNRETFLFPLKVARASAVASALEKLFPEPPVPVDRRGRPQPQLRKPKEVYVTADEATNTLIVEAPQIRRANFETLVGQLDRVELPPAASMRLYEVPKGNLKDIVETLQKLALRGVLSQRPESGGKKVDVTISPAGDGRTLIVTGDQLTFLRVEELLKRVGTTVSAEALEIQTYELKYSRAERIAPILLDFLNSRANQNHHNSFAPSVVAYPDSNVVIVSASSELLQISEQLIASLDREGESSNTSVVRVRPILFGIASRVAKDLSFPLSQMVNSTNGRPLEVVVSASEDSNSLVLVGIESEIKQVENLIASLDRSGPRQVQSITLDSSQMSAREVAELIKRISGEQGRKIEVIDVEELFESTSGPQKNSGAYMVPPISYPYGLHILAFADTPNRKEVIQSESPVIAVDEKSNTLMIVGDGQTINRLTSLINQIQKEMPTPLSHLRSIRLGNNADPKSLSLLLRQTLAEIVTVNGNRGAINKRVGLIPDELNNSLIVSANDRDFSIVSDAIKVLLVPAKEGNSLTVKVYPLANVNAERLSKSINQLLKGTGSSKQAKRMRDIAVSLVQKDETVEGVLDPSSITVIPNRNANALMVTASNSSLRILDAFIELLDQNPVSADPILRLYPLVHAKATEVVSLLRQSTEKPWYSMQNSIESSTSQPKFFADSRRNVVVVRASSSDLMIIESLVEEFDKPISKELPPLRVIALKKTKPSEVIKVLESAIIGDDQFRKKQLSLVPDDSAGVLLVRAEQGLYKEVEKVLGEIDQDLTRSEETIIKTITLKNSRASEAVALLSRVLELDYKGKAYRKLVNIGDGNSVEITATIAADKRTNSILINATSASVNVIENIIATLEKVPSEAAVEYKVIALNNALVDEIISELRLLAFKLPGNSTPTLITNSEENTLLVAATPQQFESIKKLVLEIDSPSPIKRVTEFVSLKFADAEQIQKALSVFYGEYASEADTPVKKNTRIVVDPTNNTLVVITEEKALQEILALIRELDSEKYDSSIQLQVYPLTWASANSVADTINKLFESTSRINKNAKENDNKNSSETSLFVESRAFVRASVEEKTNKVIIAASRQNLEKIGSIISMLDVSDMDSLGPVKIIKTNHPNPEDLANEVQSLFKSEGQFSKLHIVGDSVAGALIVKCEQNVFDRVNELIAELEFSAQQKKPKIRLLFMNDTPASYIADSLRETFEERASQTGGIFTLRVNKFANTLVISGSSDLLDEFEKMTKELQKENFIKESVHRVFYLKNAEARVLVDLLESILNPSKEPNRNPLADAALEQLRLLNIQKSDSSPDFKINLDSPIRLIPDTFTNSILVGADIDNIRSIKTLIDMFDSVPLTEAVAVRILKLKNIQAEEFSNLVREIFSQGKLLNKVPGTSRKGVPRGVVGRALLDEVAIAVDTRTNSVVIAGKEDAVATVEVLQKRLDSEISSGWVDVRIVPVRHADVVSIAEMIQRNIIEGFLENESKTPMEEVVGRLRIIEGDGTFVESDSVLSMSDMTILVDESSSSLLLIGSAGNLKVVTELIEMLDIPSAGRDSSVRLFSLKHASVEKFSGTLKRIIDAQIRQGVFRDLDRPAIESDIRLNTLIIAGTPRVLNFIESVLPNIDILTPVDLESIQTISLQHASATRVTGLIGDLLDARLQRLKSIDPRAAEQERAIVIPDPRNNSIFVAGSVSSFAVVQRLVKQLDTEIESESILQVIPVPTGNVSRLASLIENIMDRQYISLPETIKKAQKPLVFEDQRTGSLLVAGRLDDIKTIRRLVTDLSNVPTSPSVGIHLVSLSPGVDSNRLADRLNRIMQQRYQSLGPSKNDSDRVSVQSDQGTNSLIVASTNENLEVIQRLVALLAEAEQESEAGREYEVITLLHSQAEEVVRQLRELYLDEANKNRGEKIRVTFDSRLNAILISGTRSDIDEIQSLVTRLENEQPIAIAVIKYFPLKSASAVELSQLLQNMLSGRGLGRRRSGEDIPATVLRYLHSDPQIKSLVVDEIEVTEAVRQAIVFTPDERTNTLVVQAPEEVMNVLGTMIEDLDKTSMGGKKIRVFRLDNSDAQATKEILEDLFKLRQGNRSMVLKPASEGEAELNISNDLIKESFSTTTLTAVPDLRQQLSITVDARTNSLIVSGTENYLDLVQEVVKELDAMQANERETFVYQLRNAQAPAVAKVLTDFVEKEQSKLLKSLGDGQQGAAARMLEREITIEGDEKSNSVLVSASPRYLQRVQEIIKDLDVDPPQVLIQVMLAEVTLDNGMDWGVEFRQDVGSNTLTGGFGFSSPSALGGAGSSLLMGALGAPFSLGLATEDLNLILRALEEQSRLQILNNPQLMTANNEPGTLKVVEKLYVQEGTTVTGTGLSQVDLQQVEVGVTLEVTPTINPDGFVRLSISPVVSSLSPTTDKQSDGAETPRIFERTADTTVTVLDGQTIVLGGLIRESLSSTINKVPFLGDLPILGSLFNRSEENLARTELLIILTPRVITNPEMSSIITKEQNSRLSFPPEIIKQLENGELDPRGTMFKVEGDVLKVKDQFIGTETLGDRLEREIETYRNSRFRRDDEVEKNE